MGASVEDLRRVIGCLTTIYPQFVSKELAKIGDQISTNLQGFTDPLAAVAALDVGTLVDDAAELSEGSIFQNLSEAAAGLTAQYIKREIEELTEKAGTPSEGDLSKRINSVRGMSKKIASTGSSMLAAYNDSPYVATQRMCEALIELNETKIKTIDCIRSHMRQLVNAILVASKAAPDMKANALAAFEEMSGHLDNAKDALRKSRKSTNGQVLFNPREFENARSSIMLADQAVSPLKTGTTFLDVAYIMGGADLEATMSDKTGQALVMIAVPSLMKLVKDGADALKLQVRAINYLVESISLTEIEFTHLGESPRVKDVRDSLIIEISSRVSDLSKRVDAAISRGSVKAASAELILWSSRMKAIMASMDRANNLGLEVGSPAGPASAEALRTAQSKLVLDLTSISTGNIVEGIEDVDPAVKRIISLTKAAERAMDDIEKGRVSNNRIATLHAIAKIVADEEDSGLGESKAIATSQIDACTPFTKITVPSREQFDKIVKSMRQMGMDRGADLMIVGKFKEYLDADTESLSYLGVAISCLGGAMDIIGDYQTRKQIGSIRDDLIARRSNHEISAVDSADQGLKRIIVNLQGQIASIQRNAEVVKSISDQLKILLEQAGGSFENIGRDHRAMSGELESLQISAGGRLAGIVEEFSGHPNAGVLSCKAL